MSRIPVPRPSAHTAVGLGLVESRNGGPAIDPREERDEAVTPRSLQIDTAALRALAGDDEEARRGSVDYLAGQLRELREALSRQGGALAATARHAHHVETIVASLETKADANAKRDDAQHREVMAAIGRVSTELGDVARQVVELDLRIGTEPAQIDLTRASQVGNLTAEEIAKLEQGTGILGLVARLIAGQAKTAQALVATQAKAAAELAAAQKTAAAELARLTGIRAGVSAGATTLIATSPQWGPTAVEFFSRLLGG